ncbi:MAG: hypothetical protein WC894_05690 [Patescibacteria group bacterium]
MKRKIILCNDFTCEIYSCLVKDSSLDSLTANKKTPVSWNFFICGESSTVSELKYYD